MNIESVLQYVVADGFARIAGLINDLLEGKKLNDGDAEYIRGFTALLHGGQYGVPAELQQLPSLGLDTLTGTDTPEGEAE